MFMMWDARHEDLQIFLTEFQTLYFEVTLILSHPIYYFIWHHVSSYKYIPDICRQQYPSNNVPCPQYNWIRTAPVIFTARQIGICWTRCPEPLSQSFHANSMPLNVYTGTVGRMNTPDVVGRRFGVKKQHKKLSGNTQCGSMANIRAMLWGPGAALREK